MKYFFMLCIVFVTAGVYFNTSYANDQQLDDGVVIALHKGKIRLQLYDENIVRVTFTPTRSFPERKSLVVPNKNKSPIKWNLEETAHVLSLITPKLQVQFDRATESIAFLDPVGKVILKESATIPRKVTPATIMGESTYHVQQNFLLSDDEALYGLGQHQDGVMNYRGHDVTLVQQNTVAVVPFLVSTRGYGILWDNYSMTKFHDGPDGTFWWSDVADAIDYYFIFGENMDQVMASYRSLTGQAPLFGKWAYGYWQSKERYYRQDEIVNVVREYRRRHIPLDNIVQDWHYWGDLGWNAMDFDRKNFPDPEKMLKAIHALHAHYMISIWPNFDPKTAVHKDMDARGFIFHQKDGTGTTLYDAFNPGARDLYWKWLNKTLFPLGVDAWWMDATEPEFAGKTPDEILESAKTYGYTALGSWARYLNAFSLMTTRGVYEHQRQATDKKRVYILTRSAFAGQQRYGATTWSGDIVATWDVLRKQIPAGLNFCLSGIPYWTTDIGAFGVRDSMGCWSEAYRELYTRWFQFGAFCPMFRSHGTDTPREIWRFGEKGYWAYDTLVKFDNLRYRLLPYIYSLAWKVTHEGYTMMRGLAFDFPGDRRALNIPGEFMFGPAFLVNPVTKPMYFKNKIKGDLIPSENLFAQDGRTHGLTAEFFNGTQFEKFVEKRTVPVVDFDWNDGSRPARVNDEYYSIRFSGQVLTKEAGDYIFLTTSNDGIRLWVNGQLIIDNWTDHHAITDVGKITLPANTRCEIRIDYYQTRFSAVTRLEWITPKHSPDVYTHKIPPPKTWPVYLPGAMKWYDFWTGESFAGGQTIDAPAPIDQMPLFIKAGSLIPMGPFLQYATEKPEDPIELRIYSGADGEFTLYEDENDGYDYEKGIYAVIPIRWKEKTRTLILDPRRGEFPGMKKDRTFQIVLVRPGHGVGVRSTVTPDRVISYKGARIAIKF